MSELRRGDRGRIATKGGKERWRKIKKEEGEFKISAQRLCAEICREDRRTAPDASLLAQTRIKYDRLKFSEPYKSVKFKIYSLR